MKNYFGTSKWIKPAEGIMTSSYGERVNPILDKREFHNGIDIGVNTGTKIKAVKDGIVSEVGVSKTYGNFIKYKTVDNYTIMYAHLSEALQKAGDEVERGQIVALSGNTGLSTGPHLHVSLWLDKKLIDPMNIFEFKYTDGVRKEYEYRGVILE